MGVLLRAHYGGTTLSTHTKYYAHSFHNEVRPYGALSNMPIARDAGDRGSGDICEDVMCGI